MEKFHILTINLSNLSTHELIALARKFEEVTWGSKRCDELTEELSAAQSQIHAYNYLNN